MCNKSFTRCIGRLNLSAMFHFLDVGAIAVLRTHMLIFAAYTAHFEKASKGVLFTMSLGKFFVMVLDCLGQSI